MRLVDNQLLTESEGSKLLEGLKFNAGDEYLKALYMCRLGKVGIFVNISESQCRWIFHRTITAKRNMV